MVGLDGTRIIITLGCLGSGAKIDIDMVGEGYPSLISDLADELRTAILAHAVSCSWH